MKHQSLESFALPSAPRTSNASYRQFQDVQVMPTSTYLIAKRVFDVVMCVLLIPVLVVSALVLGVLNPFKNKGPLFYVQSRMGEDGKPFWAIKFRSMTVADKIERGANDPLETDRITRLGNFLRRSRLDEIPQIINVFKGEMSLVGPRPDYIEHAKIYADTIPGYVERHAVRPGISGYAQTEVGYADSEDSIREKVAADLYYIQNRSIRLEGWIVWRTLQTVVSRGGA